MVALHSVPTGVLRSSGGVGGPQESGFPGSWSTTRELGLHGARPWTVRGSVRYRRLPRPPFEGSVKRLHVRKTQQECHFGERQSRIEHVGERGLAPKGVRHRREARSFVSELAAQRTTAHAHGRRDALRQRALGQPLAIHLLYDVAADRGRHDSSPRELTPQGVDTGAEH